MVKDNTNYDKEMLTSLFLKVTESGDTLIEHCREVNLEYISETKNDIINGVVVHITHLNFYLEYIKEHYSVDQDRLKTQIDGKNFLDKLEHVKYELSEANLTINNKLKNNNMLTVDDSINANNIVFEVVQKFNNSKLLQDLVMHFIFIEKGISGKNIEKELADIDTQKSNLASSQQSLDDEYNNLDEKKQNLAKELESYSKKEKILSEKLDQVESEKKELSELKNEKINKYAERAYSAAANTYLKQAKHMTWAFYVFAVIGLATGITLSILYPIDAEHIANPIIQKIIVASVFILLITFFLRRASHYSSLGFKAKQTSLELEALPFFMRNVDSEKHHEIYTNLAEKYFGKELDQTQNHKIADIVQDQMKMNIEVIASAAQAIKTVSEAKKSNSEPESKP
ncbi:hypothetical protein OZX61_07440 [Acinetobacter sp. ESL0695]|uniref:hypothetical protein n=1 Tax=Acinetobacter sp. ESL0695 TaxID=2983215 RepID=UPI0023F523AB|nr:hypothetical protein [Acinetobacter sp. ESL0695]WEV48123.1 hypothetical protein OZX61_07440 [Acinetobacter sp. ESL0695]